MKRQINKTGATGGRTRIRQAEARAERAETRAEQAKTRTEAAETRTEQAETRTDSAKTRIEQAESRTEQAETTLQNVIHKMAGLPPEMFVKPLKNISGNGSAGWNVQLKRLTIRQHEILQLIAEGQNTKQIAGILKISPKTVEYHRMKLMASLNLQDVPGLVRFAMRAGLIPEEKPPAG